MKIIGHLITFMDRLNRLLLGLCKLAMIVLVGAIAADIFVGVFFRYVLGSALAWYEEVAQYLMVWMVFCGSPLVLKQGGQISLGLVVDRFPPRARMFAHATIYAVVFTFLCLLAYHGSGLAWMAQRQQMTSLPVSFSVIYAAIPFGAAIMASVSFEILLRALAGLSDPENAELFAPDPMAETAEAAPRPDAPDIAAKL
ncbi:MAG: TRAP transporter small permease [Proteobacteria bacterium]|jgi:TRAP-type C4-dicarboxylate transport system permease small subunit|nr:TRAP transporter small permease [Pseudomonadota bacterium]